MQPNSWRKKGSCGGEERIKGVTEEGRGGEDLWEDRVMALAEKQGRRSSLWTSQTPSVVCLCGINCNWSKADSEQRIREKKRRKKEGREGKGKTATEITEKRRAEDFLMLIAECKEKCLPLLDNKKTASV